MAAHRKELDLEIFARLAGIQCTLEEIAAVTGVSLKTVKRRAKEPKYAEALTLGRAKGTASIKRKQFAILEETDYVKTLDGKQVERSTRNSLTMSIWLGKQHLNQRDRIMQAGEDGKGQPAPLQLTVRRIGPEIPEEEPA